MKHNTIEIKLNSYGTLEVVSIPVKLYKDSYNVVKLRVNAPLKEKTMLKVYSSSRDEAGEQIWTSATYSLPQKTTTKIDGVDYNVYEGYVPQEFCEKEGDVVITFAQVVDNNGIEEILTSGALNLYISGEGFNYNGVNTGIKLSEMDGLAIEVNDLNVEVSNIKEDIVEIKEDASLIKQNIEDVNTRLDDIKIPTKVSELENDALYASTNQVNNWTSPQNFKTTVTFGRSFDPIIEISKWRKTGTEEPQYPAIFHKYKDYPQLSLLFPDESGTIALTKNHYTKEEVNNLIEDASITSDTLLSIINDSKSIVATKDGDKVRFEIDAEIQSKISKALVTPMSRPSQTELVGVDNTGSQTMLSIGSGLSLTNGTLSASGNGGVSVNVVDTLVSQSTSDALSARQGNVLYNMITDTGKEINQNELNAQKHIFIGGNGVLQGNVYNFTIQDASSYIAYRTNLTKFLVDLNLGISGDLDKTKEVAITFGDTTYYLFNILKGNQHATIGDLQQVERYSNATGYRFIAEMTFFQTSDLVGFAIIPTISVSDVLSLDSDQMDDYMADGGLSQGQLAICNKVITNGYSAGSLYRFDITYPNTYSWTQLSYSKAEIDTLIGDIETLLSEV